MRPTLIIMVKEPRPGRVKTRLGRDIGMVRAAWWFRHQTCSLIRRLRDPRWDIILAVSPDAEGLTSRVWPAELPRVAQGTGNLGDRMARLFRRFAPSPTCIIGADIPGIQRAHIAEAFRALGSREAVLGPAPDGGYWLVGFKPMAAVPSGLFQNVRWSSKHALSDTVTSMSDMRISYVSEQRDVDQLADLELVED